MSPQYPPPLHALRDLDFEVETVDAGHHVATYRPAGEGATELGGLVTVVDLLAGTLCMAAVAPDWMATSGLTLHAAGALPTGPMQVDARLERCGRTTVAVRVEVLGADGRSVAQGVVGFSRLVRREGNLTLDRAGTRPGDRFSFDAERPRPVGRGGSFAHAAGCEVLDAATGTTSTEVDDYVRNSFGAVNGGLVATIVERAATAYGAHHHGASVEVTDLVLHYLAQGRVGPVRTSVTAVRPGCPGMLAVEVVETGGAEHRLMALAHVGIAGVRATGAAPEQH